MCLPTSCTSNEADIALMISMVGNAEGESEGAAACTGSYTYDGLGDGTPDSVSCKLDMIENGDTFTEFYFLHRIVFHIFSLVLGPSLKSASRTTQQCRLFAKIMVIAWTISLLLSPKLALMDLVKKT